MGPESGPQYIPVIYRIQRKPSDTRKRGALGPSSRPRPPACGLEGPQAALDDLHVVQGPGLATAKECMCTYTYYICVRVVFH